MKSSIRFISLLFSVIFSLSFATGQIITEPENSEYKFKIIKNLDATPIENQYHTGTCWCFSSLSFFESELSRINQEPVNLSEMFVVWHSYADKAKRYVRMHGDMRYGQGGAFHDVRYVAENYGLLPEEVYPVKDKPEHGELHTVLKGILDGVIENKNGSLTSNWFSAFTKVLNTYLGEIPEEFEFQGKTYTPKSYAESLGINPNDYVEITSFTHHPFYEQFILEVPDNWRWDKVYNVPLDEFQQILEHAVMNNYSVAWATDVSGKGFSYSKGVAIVPETPWEDLGKDGMDSVLTHPVAQKNITQTYRQDGFDRYKVTDDHGMHITGMAKDQNGTRYYIVKNSWGTDNNCNGYLYASEAYVLYNSTNIMVHKDAIPKKIAKKLGIDPVSN